MANVCIALHLITFGYVCEHGQQAASHNSEAIFFNKSRLRPVVTEPNSSIISLLNIRNTELERYNIRGSGKPCKEDNQNPQGGENW